MSRVGLKEFARGQGVASIGCHAKVFGLYAEDNQDPLKHFQGELKMFLRSMLLQASTGDLLSQISGLKSTREFFSV